jgi:cytochrome c-type biogenesis protein CcmF
LVPEIGHLALVLALCLAALQGTIPLVGAERGEASWMAMARPAANAQLLFLLVAFGALSYAFVASDFSVAYVAQHSNLALPLRYRLSAVWGGHEGSLLLWALILALWTAAVTRFSRSVPPEFVARVVAVMGLVSVGFLLFLLATSNPFERLLPAPVDGRDLNPLLQDPGLIIHPPMLYMGYVGLAVPFSFAVAALLEGRVDAAWTRWARPWTTVAWVFLTLGITLGSWWAYYELGWGGWWFWDPVENASFLPWLMATALLHSLAVTEKRGAFKSWTILLALFTFSLSLLGTFLVRSGVLVSVHAFATDPARGVFILCFLAFVTGTALVLYAWRANTLGRGGSFELVSRETLLLTNNVVLVVACASVLLGTLYPLFLDALQLGKISVGPPYFNAVFVPLMLPLLIILGFAPLAHWKHDEWPALAKRLGLALALTTAGAGAVTALAIHPPFSLGVVAGLAATAWILYGGIRNLLLQLAHKQNKWRGLLNLPRSFIGMSLAHLGVATFILGVTLTSALSVEQDLRMAPGDTKRLAGYDFKFEGVGEVVGPNYRAREGTVRVTRAGREVALLQPQKRFYAAQEQAMTEAAIDPGLTRDIYVALGEPLGDGAWSVRLYHKPFLRCIWLGTLLMALGGLVAISDRRYRLAIRSRRPTIPASSGQNPTPTLAP